MYRALAPPSCFGPITLETGKQMLILRRLFLTVLLLAGVLLLTVRLMYGGGREGFPDRTGEPLFSADVMETVAETEYPPGNIAVAPDGRVFFTLHPEGRPPVNVVHWTGQEAVPWPSADYQPGGSEPLAFQEILSLRIDQQNRLWVLDNAVHGTGQPRLLAFDLDSRELLFRHDFAPDIMPLGSHANDFQVDAEGRYVYIADASLFRKQPALVVVDVQNGSSLRRLDSHPSVLPEDWIPVVAGRSMQVLGLFTVAPGVDSIGLDRQGEWLYYAAVNAGRMYRLPAATLRDPNVSEEQLSQAVEVYAEKTMSDGITTDDAGNLYLSDLEHSAILRLGEDRTMQTLLKDPRIRWPDGFSFGPDGWLYFTCSSLHQVIGFPPSTVLERGPYQVFRFRPGGQAVAGH